MGHSTLTMTKLYCATYNADIAKNYDRVSPLAQMYHPREKIFLSKTTSKMIAEQTGADLFEVMLGDHYIAPTGR